MCSLFKHRIADKSWEIKIVRKSVKNVTKRIISRKMGTSAPLNWHVATADGPLVWIIKPTNEMHWLYVAQHTSLEKNQIFFHQMYVCPVSSCDLHLRYFYFVHIRWMNVSFHVKKIYRDVKAYVRVCLPFPILRVYVRTVVSLIGSRTCGAFFCLWYRVWDYEIRKKSIRKV